MEATSNENAEKKYELKMQIHVFKVTIKKNYIWWFITQIDL